MTPGIITSLSMAGTTGEKKEEKREQKVGGIKKKDETKNSKKMFIKT